MNADPRAERGALREVRAQLRILERRLPGLTTAGAGGALALIRVLHGLQAEPVMGWPGLAGAGLGAPGS